MNLEKLNELMVTYSTIIGLTGVKTLRSIMPGFKMKFGIPKNDRRTLLVYAYEVICHIKSQDSKNEQYLRYLGFVKGILWTLGSGTLERIESVTIDRYETYLQQRQPEISQVTNTTSRLLIVFSEDESRSRSDILAYTLGIIIAIQDLLEDGGEPNTIYTMFGMVQAMLWICGIFSLQELHEHLW